MKSLVKITAAFFLLSAGTAFSQYSTRDSLLARQYMQQRGFATGDLRNLAKTYAKRDSLPRAPKASDTLDSASAAALAATNARLRLDTLRQISVYEAMVTNKTIDPDSLLRTLTVFGLDLFTGAKPSTFVPADYGATPADYVVGTGDEVVVFLWGRINEGEYRLRVDHDGKINIPRIGPIAVAGLPFNALQKNILDRVQNIEGVQATVSLGELRSIGVFVVGEVKAPGYYTVSGLSSVTNVLFAAGGPSRRGSFRNVQIKRNGAVVATVDLYDFLLSGKDNANVRLKSGDVVMVPIARRMVAVAGNVRRSALYEIKSNASLKEALGLAGGISPAGWGSRIQIERFKDNAMQVVLDLTTETPQAVPDFEVQDGDVIKVFPVVEKNKNAVYLSGNVTRPGKYEYKPGMRLSDILPDFDALLPETYLAYALILRQEPPTFESRLVPFNLKDGLADHASPGNVVLRPRDEVIIYSRDYFEPDRTVYIDGAVTTPGKQKLLDNMKIRDLIIKAGGPTEDASPTHGELYRRTFNGELVQTEKIDFCVSCALDGDSASNISLRKSDRVYLRTKKGWQEECRVVLKGEFMFPGEYVILEKETMGHLIERAGGFTSEAYLPAAVVTRASVKILEQKRVEEYINRLEGDAIKMSTELAAKGQQVSEAQGLLAQQEALFGKLKALEPIGRIVIDLTRLSAYRDFILENGDTITVPKPSGTVSVIGEVFNPATFRLDADRIRASDYLEMAGGFKETADRKNIYIARANGSIVSNKKADVLSLPLLPGDVVVVPPKIQFQNNFKVFMDTVSALFQIATILSTVAALILAINAAGK
jgi:protein involved in polysaccharide export with SLBB domain